jgi:cytochrome c556
MARLAARTSSLVVLAVALTMAAPAVASAQDAPPEVAYRQNVMQAMLANYRQIQAVGDLGHTTHTVHYARALYGLGEILGDAFRDGTPDGSRSLPAIWEDRSGYADAVTAYEVAAAKLLEAAEMRNESAVQASFEELAGSCGACHETFRAPADQQ